MQNSWKFKIYFKKLFYLLNFDKNYVEVVVSDFTMNLIISKWLRIQKFRQKIKTMRQDDIEVKEEIVFESVFSCLNT